MQVAIGKIVRVVKQKLLTFFLPGCCDEDFDLISHTKYEGNRKHWIIIFEEYTLIPEAKSHLVHLPHLTLPFGRNYNNKYKSILVETRTLPKVSFPPFHQFMRSVVGHAWYATRTALLRQHRLLTKNALLVSTANVTLTKRNTVMPVTNTNAFTYTKNNSALIANFIATIPLKDAYTKSVTGDQACLIWTHLHEWEHILS